MTHPVRSFATVSEIFAYTVDAYREVAGWGMRRPNETVDHALGMECVESLFIHLSPVQKGKITKFLNSLEFASDSSPFIRFRRFAIRCHHGSLIVRAQTKPKPAAFIPSPVATQATTTAPRSAIASLGGHLLPNTMTVYTIVVDSPEGPRMVLAGREDDRPTRDDLTNEIQRGSFFVMKAVAECFADRWARDFGWETHVVSEPEAVTLFSSLVSTRMIHVTESVSILRTNPIQNQNNFLATT